MAHRRIFSFFRSLAVLAALGVLMAGPVIAQGSQETGAGSRGNAGGSPTFHGPGPTGDVGVLWELEIPEGYVPGTPVAWSDYVLMVATSEEFGTNLVVHDLHTGDFLWNYSEEGIFSDPFISDAHVYLTQDDRRFALDIATGDLLWDVTLDDGEPVVGDVSGRITASDGVVYTNQNATLFAMDGSTGEELWRRTFAGFSVHQPVIARDVVVVSSDAWEEDQFLANRLHGISRETGNEVWRRDGRDQVFGYVAGHDGDVVLAVEYPASELVLSDADILGYGDGQVLWSPFTMCDEPNLSLVVPGDMYHCYGSTSGFDAATGKEIELPSVLPEPGFAVARVGSHLILSDDRALLTAVDLATGEMVWSHDFAGEIGELGDGDLALFTVSAGNGALAVQIFILTGDEMSPVTFVLGELPASEATPVATPAN